MKKDNIKNYTISYKVESSCRKCPDDELEQYVQDFGDRLLTFEDGKPVIYYSWDDLKDMLPTRDITIKEDK